MQAQKGIRCKNIDIMGYHDDLLRVNPDKIIFYMIYFCNM